jgi:hypothetical protein
MEERENPLKVLIKEDWEIEFDQKFPMLYGNEQKYAKWRERSGEVIEFIRELINKPLNK